MSSTNGKSSQRPDLRDFREVQLPHLRKRVLRLGVAGNYGLAEDDIRYAAEAGVRFWVWTPRFKQVTPALRELFRQDREAHVVAMLGVAYTAGMVRRGVERALRELKTDYLDAYLLSWMGKFSFFSSGIQETLVRLKEEGKVHILGTSIHDRKRAGELARDSVLDLLMIRYNAKHPGAEQDIFPHLAQRDPVVVAYTATSWRQLLRPFPDLTMPPWPGASEAGPVPPLTAPLAYRFCLGSPHVHVVLTGPKDRAQLDENLKALSQGPLSAEEEAWVRQYGALVKAKKRLPFL